MKEMGLGNPVDLVCSAGPTLVGQATENFNPNLNTGEHKEEERIFPFSPLLY